MATVSVTFARFSASNGGESMSCPSPQSFADAESKLIAAVVRMRATMPAGSTAAEVHAALVADGARLSAHFATMFDAATRDAALPSSKES